MPSRFIAVVALSLLSIVIAVAAVVMEVEGDGHTVGDAAGCGHGRR